MSIAAAQYAQFLEKAAKDRCVHTFTEQGEFLVFMIGGREVVPFWAGRSRLEKIQQEHVKYQKYEIKEMALAEFVAWLPSLFGDRISIGTNWSGKKLVGYDTEADQLLKALQYRIEKVGHERSTGSSGRDDSR